MKFFKQLLVISIVAVVLYSCSKKTPTETKYIPKDASAVVVVNPKSLEDKLKSGNLTLDSFINRIERTGDTMNAKDKKMFNDFKNSGVSFEDNIYFFMTQKGKLMENTTNTYTVLGILKDEAKFEKYVKENEAMKEVKIEKENNFSYAATDKDAALAWNKEVVMFTYYQKYEKTTYDSLGNYKMPNNTQNKQDLKEQVKKYFNLPETERITTVSYFNDMFKEKADMYMFGTSAGTLAYLSSMPLNIPKLNDLLKDNYAITYANFEDGKVVAKSSYFTNPLMSNILKKYAGPTINTAVLEKYPSQNMNGFMQFAFNPEILNAVVKELEVSGMIDQALAQQGLTTSDVLKALKGEINLFVSDFSLTIKDVPMPSYYGGSAGGTYKKQVPNAKVLLSATVGDKTAFTNIMQKAIENKLVEKTATGYTAGPLLKMFNIVLSVEGDNLIVSSDEGIYKDFVAGTSKSNISSDVLNLVKGKAGAGYVNINSIVTAALKGTSDSAGTKILNLVNNSLKDGYFTSDNFDGKTMKSDMQLRMVNEKQNSLVTLMNMITDIAAIIKADDHRYNNQNNMPALNNGPGALGD